MTSRFAVPIEQLEAQARVADAEQVELQAQPRLDAPLLDGPSVHPFGDGATGPDGDGD
jgi:hypothetical protein